MDRWVVEVVKELRGREEALRVQGYWGAADHLKQLIATAPSAKLGRDAIIEACATVALEQRCERGTPWDLACVTIAEAIRKLNTVPE